MTQSPDSPQFSTFKDRLARRILAHPGILNRSEAESSAGSDALDDFTTYLAEEIWPYIPSTLQEATYENLDSLPDIDDLPLENIPTAFSDTLISLAASSKRLTTRQHSCGRY